MVAHVIIDNPASQVDIEFDYLIPDGVDVQEGMRVRVPFGRGDHPTMGIVLSISEESTFDGQLKEIAEVLDLTPSLSSQQISLAQFIREDAICPMCRCFNQMIPQGRRLKEVTYYKVVNASNLDAELVNLFNGEEIIKKTDRLNQYKPKLLKALKDGTIQTVYDAVAKVPPKWTTLYTIDEGNYFEQLSRTTNPMRASVMQCIHQSEDGLTAQAIIEETGASHYIIEKLTKEGILNKKYIPSTSIKEKPLITKQVFDDHFTYLDSFMKQYHEKKTLLYVSSNKEEELAYLLRVINDNLSIQKHVLVLVPDILRGAEISSKLEKYLNASICNLSANLSMSKLMDYYDLATAGKYQVVVTTPACSLWDYPNLGCIVMMDQESKNYRNDQSPRYDLNIVMQKASDLRGCKLIYTSYSPLLKTYTESLLNNITLQIKLNPLNNQVRIIDMAGAIKRMESNIIAKELEEAINDTFNIGKSVVLLLNNKSYATSISCRSCGNTIKCPKCGMPLQYHKNKNELYCPSCFYKQRMVVECDRCHSDKISFEGLGVERLAEYLKQHWPDKTMALLTESNELVYQEIMDNLDEQKCDFVITTDTFAHSFNAKRIGLVAIINLDAVLNYPSFDASHQAYSMLSHANSLLENGLVIIQTFSPNHYLLKDFVNNDYNSFYLDEIEYRKILKVEPLYEVNRILIKGEYKMMYEIANSIKKVLLMIKEYEIIVIGPAYNYKEQSVQLIVKHKCKTINEIYMRIYQLYQKSSTTIIFDRYSKVIV